MAVNSADGRKKKTAGLLNLNAFDALEALKPISSISVFLLRFSENAH